MTVRYVCGAVTAVALTCGVPAVAGAQILPPEESGMVTVMGCLQRGDADHKDQYILANPVPGPVSSVPEATCNAPVDERAFDLDKIHKVGINESLVGHWIEVSGRLERETHVTLENLRELSALSFRVVPVVPPRREAAAIPPPYIAPPPAPTADATPQPEEKPAATSGTAPQTLPKTSSSMPAIGLLGLLALAGGFALRVSRLHERG